MSNPYYTHSGYPSSRTIGSSAAMRAELAAVQAGFERLPDLASNAGRAVRVNAEGTALEAVSAGYMGVPDADASGVDPATTSLQSLINTFKQSAVASVTSILAGSTPVEVDLAGGTFKLDNSLDFTHVYRVKFKNGRINADAAVSWIGKPMLNIAMESGVPYPSDNWRQQRIRDLTFENIVFDGKLIASIALLQSTYGVMFDTCTFVGIPSNGYGLRTVPNPRATTPPPAFPAVGQTKNSHLVVKNCNFSQAELSDDTIDGAGIGLDINTADFEITGCKAWKLDVCCQMDNTSNGQLLGNHFFTKGTKFCVKIGPNMTGVISQGNYWDTGPMELRSYNHYIADGFLAGADLKLVVAKANEDMAGLVCNSLMGAHPILVFENGGTLNTLMRCNFAGSRKTDGSAVRAPSVLRVGRGGKAAVTLGFTDFDATDGAGFYSPGPEQMAWANGGQRAWGTDAAGRLTIGPRDTGVPVYGTANPEVQVHGDSTKESTFAAVRWDSAAGGSGGQFIVGRSNSDVIGAYVALPANKVLGRFAFVGDNGVSLALGASIFATTGGIWSNVSQPTKLSFSTVDTGSTVLTERWAITPSGHLIPDVDNTTDLGSATKNVRKVYAQNVVLKPGATDSPANNGELTFRVISNTEVRVGLRGTDGVLRWSTLPAFA